MKKLTPKRSNLGMHKSWMKGILTSIFALLISVSLSIPALGQSLSEFKSRSGKEGVESIPYSSLRSTADRAEDAKEDAHDEAKSKFGYEALKLKKRQATNDMKTAKSELDEAKDALDEQKRYLPDDIDDQEKAFKAAEKALKEVEERMKSIEVEISNGQKKWKEVAALREKVKQAFDKVEEELEESKDRPENHIGRKPTDPEDLEEWEEDREELNKYIDKILGHIRSQKSGHDQAKKQANQVAANLGRL